MRAVLDTNVLVSGIHWSGASEKVLRAWFLNRFELVSSIEIIDEFIETMMSFKIPMKIEDILRWENLLIEKSKLVASKEKVDIVKNDPDDNKFIEAALEGGAEYIVTMDKHLLKISEYRNIKILTPRRIFRVV